MRGLSAAGKVSIITPSYNSEQFVTRAIQSVMEQTYENWEMIIVDDCSADNSAAIVTRLAEKDARLRFHRNGRNQGPAVARNFAIGEAKGKYIAFLDADDQWKPHKLEEQIRFMLDNDVAFAYTDYSTVSEDGTLLKFRNKPPEKISYHTLLKSNYIGCLTAMYDVEKLGKIFMPDLKKRQDYGLWLSILKKIPYAYRAGSEPLAVYTARSKSVSSNKLKLIGYNWRLFYTIERMSLAKSIYYLTWNIANKIFK